MADPGLTLESGRISAEPGGQARVRVTIRNPGVIVEGYRLDVLGDGTSQWAEIVPAEVNVFPAEEATAVVVFSPPAGSAAPSGVWPFGVRARSVVHPEESTVVEGDVEIGKVLGVQAKLVPVTSSGRWRGRHVIKFSNWGNAPVTLRLAASNPDDALGFLIRPEVIDLPLGSSVLARLWVRTRHPFLRGSRVRLPFTVVAERDQAAPTPGAPAAIATSDRPVLDGALNQMPILGRAVVTLAIFALIAILAGVAFVLTRPPASSSSFEESVPPPKPKGLKAIATGFDTVSLTWQAIPQIKGYEIRSKLGAGAGGAVFDVTQIDPAVTTKTMVNLPPATIICFQIRAIGFRFNGPLSDEACAKTANAPPSQSPPPSSASPSSASPTSAPPSSPQSVSQTATGPTSGTTDTSTATSSAHGSTPPLQPTTPDLKGKWIAAGMYWVDATHFDNGLLQKYVMDLRAAGLNPQMIDSASYPRLTPDSAGAPLSPSWIVFTGPYETAPQAQRACDNKVSPVTSFCRVLQPDPG